MALTMPYQSLPDDVRRVSRERRASPGDRASQSFNTIIPDIRLSRRFARTG
ncbi:hypothetical protein ABH945_005120 [Paraburkholderia sp. GAS333]|uniref:hypothetical protein n=1 Tax=Paraburkholderia sp. GAS333 TaxID=3156279 RepID=UPI003D2588A3